MSDGVGWDAARALAATADPLPDEDLPLPRAIGAVPVEPILAPGPLPHYDSSAMDGWAVAGPPPWRLDGSASLTPGSARPIVTGGLVPGGTTAIVASERGAVRAGLLHADSPRPGAHIRPAGEEAATGDLLVEAGTRLTAAHVAMLAVAGLDAVRGRRAPIVQAVLTGDEVQTAGRPAPGRVRDAFDPLLPVAVAALGGRPLAPIRAPDDAERIAALLRDTAADVVITTGGTGRSGVDHLRGALQRCGAVTVFDGVAMRPGHPTVLAHLPDGRPLLALPGNPLAAVVALLSFLPAVLAGRLGLEVPVPISVLAAVPIAGFPGRTGVLPARTGPSGLTLLEANRPGMVRGLAAADLLAVIPPGGVPAGGALRALPLPW